MLGCPWLTRLIINYGAYGAQMWHLMAVVFSKMLKDRAYSVKKSVLFKIEYFFVRIILAKVIVIHNFIQTDIKDV